MKVLVTGATGFIGYAVAKRLADAGAQPRLLVRRQTRGALLAGLQAETVQADLSSEQSLLRACEGVDVVIHLAARATFESFARLRPTIVDGSCRLMRAAGEAGVQRLVYAGSLFVYDSQDEPIDRQTPARPAIDYGRAKLEAERQMAEIGARSGVQFTSLRLPHVYGPRSLLFERIRRGYVVFPGPMTNICAHLHILDAAEALIAAACCDWTGTAPIADRSVATWREFTELVHRYHPRLKVIGMPRWVALGGAYVARALTSFLPGPALTTPGTVRGFNLNLPVSSDDVWRDLGVEPLYPKLANGIPAALDANIPFRWRHPVRDRAA